MPGSKNLYTRLIAAIHNFLFGIRKSIAVFVLSMFVGILPFVIYYMSTEGTYKASFTVVYDDLVRKIYGDRLEKLNTLISQNQTKQVATLLNLPETTANSIVKIQGTNILGEDLTKDLNTDKIPFVVKFVVRDKKYVNNVQEGIVNFLESGSDYMANRKSMRNEEITDELNFIDHQLNLIDSVKRIEYNSNVNPPLTTDAKNDQITGSGSLFEFSYQLYKKKQELLKKQKASGTIQVIDDAIVSTNANKPLGLLIILGVIAGFVIYAIMILFIIPVITYKEA